MESTIGTKPIIWATIGTELVHVVFDLRYMVLLSFALILADLWWGYRCSKVRLEEAKEAGNATLQDKYRWHKSRAVRRTANKVVDYLTYLIVGSFLGLGITEPMGICSHVWTAAIGLGLGCGCEIASIIGHVAYVKAGVEISVLDGWRALWRFIGRLFKSKSQEIGDAIESLGESELPMS